MQQGCKRSKWVSTCLLKSFLAAIILPHVRHLNFTTPSSSCLAIIESRLALKSEKWDYVRKKEDTKIFCSFYFVGYTISITYLSCLCHLDTWLVREFFVLKSFPQWSQVWGFVGRCVSMWASKLSFLFPTLPQTLHLKNFWPSSKSSNIRFSGSGNPGMWLDLAKWNKCSENSLIIWILISHLLVIESHMDSQGFLVFWWLPTHWTVLLYPEVSLSVGFDRVLMPCTLSTKGTWPQDLSFFIQALPHILQN